MKVLEEGEGGHMTPSSYVSSLGEPFENTVGDVVVFVPTSAPQTVQ